MRPPEEGGAGVGVTTVEAAHSGKCQHYFNHSDLKCNFDRGEFLYLKSETETA